MSRYSQNVLWSILAALVYGAFAFYLYEPHFDRFSRWQWLLPFGAWAGALGCFILSRRWVVGLLGSLLAGAVYGFGPFLLSLARYHPTVGLLAASVPWLFLPAAYMGKKWHGVFAPFLCLLPFLVIVLFFRIGAWQDYRLFAAPIQIQPECMDLVGFLAPLAMVNDRDVLVSLYHVPVAPLLLGLALMFRARRFGVLLIVVLGLALTFCRCYLGPAHTAWFGISPILWFSIPLTCLAVLTGVGFQGLVEAGLPDRNWILAIAIALGALAIVALLLAAECFQVFCVFGDGHARLFVEAAKMYLLGAMTVAMIYLVTRLKLKLRLLRQPILAAALALDIFLAARYIIDHIAEFGQPQFCLHNYGHPVQLSY